MSNKQKKLRCDRPQQIWTVTNSFRAAYFTWNNINHLSSLQRETKRDFDYGEFPLEQFYNLILETTENFSVVNLAQKTTIGLEINKDPFIISRGTIGSENIPQAFNHTIIPYPYLPQDFISKQNYLGLFIEHELTLSDRLTLNLEGTLDLAIEDTTDIPELPTVEPIENHNFYPEISLDYQLTNNIFLFTTVSYAAEPITEIDANNKPFNSEIYRGLELGIETELKDNWLVTFSFYHESQDNITTIDPNNLDFDLQINQQTNNSWTGEINGEIVSNWWLYGFYTYSDTQVTEDEIIKVDNKIPGIAPHSAGLWTSYEIPKGRWKGLGFGSGITWNSDRPGDANNSFNLPGYLQTDLAIFYSQNKFKTAISIQNLFNAGIKDDNEITPRTILGTVFWEF